MTNQQLRQAFTQYKTVDYRQGVVGLVPTTDGTIVVAAPNVSNTDPTDAIVRDWVSTFIPQSTFGLTQPVWLSAPMVAALHKTIPTGKSVDIQIVFNENDKTLTVNNGAVSATLSDGVAAPLSSEQLQLFQNGRPSNETGFVVWDTPAFIRAMKPLADSTGEATQHGGIFTFVQLSVTNDSVVLMSTDTFKATRVDRSHNYSHGAGVTGIAAHLLKTFIKFEKRLGDTVTVVFNNDWVHVESGGVTAAHRTPEGTFPALGKLLEWPSQQDWVATVDPKELLAGIKQVETLVDRKHGAIGLQVDGDKLVLFSQSFEGQVPVVGAVVSEGAGETEKFVSFNVPRLKKLLAAHGDTMLEFTSTGSTTAAHVRSVDGVVAQALMPVRVS